jgi:EAL domain-containing protein (putative c-di-GMP-specific phosphodiesterase class I)
LGPKLVLDDFNIGYPAISTYGDLPFDFYSLPGSWLRSEVASRQERAAIAAAIAIARSFGARVIADGSLHEEMLAYLAESGCDIVQSQTLPMHGKPQRPAPYSEDLPARRGPIDYELPMPKYGPHSRKKKPKRVA